MELAISYSPRYMEIHANFVGVSVQNIYVFMDLAPSVFNIFQTTLVQKKALNVF